MKRAFTLAEVLITLAIIGVVAAMTIPTLIQKHQEKVTVTKLKKFYSVMSQAYQQAVFKEGTADNWNLIASDSPEGAENMLNVLAQYLKVQKNCGRNQGCLPNIIYKTATGANSDDITSPIFAKMVLADGAAFYLLIRSGNCTNIRGLGELMNVCAMIYVDTNGFKPPNTYARDLFVFYATKNSIIPLGTHKETNYTFDKNCKLPTSNGIGCAAWVILNENLDYLHCDDLAWGGKTTCK